MSQLLKFIQKCNTDLLDSSNESEINVARQYLFNDRNINEETCQIHSIGYCRKDLEIPDEVRYYGTIHKPQRERWDLSRKIQGKLIVPIFSEFGEPLALAMRTPISEPGNPWWNFPFPFKKGNHLFLFNKSKKESFKKNKLYIVEGYVDALCLFQNGLHNVAAVMGTAYTMRKVALTARYCNNVCLCFDSDPNQSGEKAKQLSIAVLNKYSFCESISVIDSLPLKEDPASFVGSNGIGEFLEMERVLDEEEITRICLNIKSKNGKLIDAK